jgi:chromosome segregation ATPase
MDINTPGSDVNTTGAASASETVDDYSFLDDSGNVVGDSVAKPATTPDSQQMDTGSESSNGTQSVEDKVATQATDVQNSPAKADLPIGIKRRIDKLTARVKQAEEQRHLMEQQAAKFEQAFKLLQEQYQTKESRLSELEGDDPVASENERLRFEQKVRQAQENLNKDFQAKLQQAQRTAKISTMADQILEEVEDAITRYPTVSQVELAYALRSSPGTKVFDLAKQIHEQKYKALENEFASKYKERLSAPVPVTPNGSSTKRQLKTDQDLIDELDAMLGADWNNRR